MPDWARIHEEKSFKASYIPLYILSFIYGAIVRLRLAVLQDRRAMSLPGFTVSIGNLTTGGTGKTPATRMIAEWAAEEGYKVAVLSRGYGGKKKRRVTIVSDGKDILADPKEIGDEPCLLAKRLPGIPVVVSKNRYLAGLEAQIRFGCTFFILDDGYQHLKLKRDLNLLLVDASSPFGNGHLLPLGPLREPSGEFKRTDAIILTRAGYTGNNIEKEGRLKKLFHGKPVFTGDHVPENIIFPARHEEHPPSFLKGKRVIAFAGIARPFFFRDTLISLGAEILSYRAFPDHHPFTLEEIESLMGEKDTAGADYLITTEKDWVRLADLLPQVQFLAYLTIKFDILSEKKRFFTMIRESMRKKGYAG
jgi:tetraacyldisaccharide 4'-kinase